MKIRVFLLLVLLMSGGSASTAAALYCKGKISKVFVRDNGDLLVYLDWRRNYSKL
ncbi:hypothetical protein TQ33_0286 [Kangiella geojedonensis]|uniref:Uncharacterized protein n=1 Tax=Kangiella geojedonensis TaxID=914150 RepID=A0A0F6TP77_9GAMM|nr:hypothetical protein TQ33_0286 [Kangiella geojedonensis]